jgi:hypothetical protein
LPAHQTISHCTRGPFFQCNNSIKTKGTQIGKKKIKIHLFTNNTIYVEHLKKSIKELLESVAGAQDIRPKYKVKISLC